MLLLLLVISSLLICLLVGRSRVRYERTGVRAHKVKGASLKQEEDYEEANIAPRGQRNPVEPKPGQPDVQAKLEKLATKRVI